MSFSRPEDLHADTKRPSGAGRLFQLQGVPLLREAELHRGLQEEQRDEPQQEQPGEALPVFGTSSDWVHASYVSTVKSADSVKLRYLSRIIIWLHFSNSYR